MVEQNMYRYDGAALAAEAAVDERMDFIRRTYVHLVGAVLAFVGLEILIFQAFDVEAITRSMLGFQYSWLLVLGLFMAVSWVARWWASSDTSVGLQYAGLSLYVIAQAVIFVPLLFIAGRFGENIIPTAAVATAVMFTALSLIVFFTRADFSFLRGVLIIGGIAAMVLIVVAVIFGFDLGIFFTVAMIALACGYILYDTSNVLHHYRTTQHVAASLALFASLALLLWYVIRLLMYLNRR